MNENGMTLPELMIAVVIAVMITAAGYSFFTNTTKFSILHSRKAEMQRESRVALDIMSREIRNAGFGIIEPLTGVVQGGVSTIQAGNNVDPDPSGAANELDRITLLGGYRTVGTLNAAAARGANQITIDVSPGVDISSPDINGQTITIEGFYLGTITARTGTITTGTLTINPPLNRDFTQNNSVSIVQTVVYHVAAGPTPGSDFTLYRNDGTGDQVIASGIEDLQFSYLLNDGTVVDNPPATVPPTVSPIRAVTISLLARRLDPNTSATVSIRPALMDHAAGAAKDRYHRLVLTKVAEVRSLGLLN
jgi:prepilin-type N-terminal cleavage/methylation domain-containing protein